MPDVEWLQLCPSQSSKQPSHMMMASGTSASVLPWATHARVRRTAMKTSENLAAAEDKSVEWNVGSTAHFRAVIGIHLSVNWLGVKYLLYKPGEADLWSGW